jgi:hypothetical protein
MGPSKAVLTMSAPVLQPKSKTSKILFGPVNFFSFYLDIYGMYFPGARTVITTGNSCHWYFPANPESK